MIAWLTRFSIRTRTVLLVGVGLAIILAALILLSMRALQESSDRVLAERLRLAELVAAHIDDHVGEAQALLERIATSEGFDLTDADPEPERRALRELYRTGLFSYDVFITDKNKEPHIVAFVPLSQAPWAVSIEQPEAEALKPVYALRQQWILAGAAVLLATVLLVWIATQAVLDPLSQLLAASRRVAAGDLETPVPALGRDEISQLGQALEEMRRRLAAWGEELERQVAERTRELSALYAIDRAAAQSLDLDEILDDSLDTVLDVLEVDAAGILLLEPDGETMTLQVHRGLSEEFVEAVRYIRLGEGISGRAVAEEKSVVLDVPDYPTGRLAPVVVEEGFQTLVSTPLVAKGRALGALTLGTRRPRAFPPEELALLTAIGRQLGGAVANARLHQETRQRAERLALLNRIAHALSTSLNLDELLEIVHQEITAAMEAEAFFIALYDRPANELDYRIRMDKGLREPPERRPLSAGLTASIVTSKQPILIRDFEREKEHLPPVKSWGTMQAPPSWLGVPMLLGDNVVGVISVQAYRPNAYGEAEQELLSTIADAVAVAIENARLYQSLEQSKAELEVRVHELERFTRLAVGRELRMKELKERIRELERRVEEHG